MFLSDTTTLVFIFSQTSLLEIVSHKFVIITDLPGDDGADDEDMMTDARLLPLLLEQLLLVVILLLTLHARLAV